MISMFRPYGRGNECDAPAFQAVAARMTQAFQSYSPP
jgi:hypothetical protein